jgi:hypothetical protein
LERIEESAFSKSGLKSILIPSSVVVLGKESFYSCESLGSVTFENGSRLERIGQSAFFGTGSSLRGRGWLPNWATCPVSPSGEISGAASHQVNGLLLCK